MGGGLDSRCLVRVYGADDALSVGNLSEGSLEWHPQTPQTFRC